MASGDPAPALARGLNLLRILEREGASTLDQLTTHSALPKSSVLRLLRSLEAFGAVERDPTTRRYTASMILVPARRGELSDALRGELVPLAEATGASAECYAWAEGRLQMIDRADPESASVIVRNRIGVARNLAELEALSQVVHAHADPPSAGRSWAWGPDGTRERLTRAERERRIAAARGGLGRDPHPNSYGVYRLAAPVLDGDGRLLAVLALARAWSERRPALDRTAAANLTDTAARVSARCGHRLIA